MIDKRHFEEIMKRERERERERLARGIFHRQRRFFASKEIRPSRTSTSLAEQVHRDGCPMGRTQHDTMGILNTRDKAFRNLSPPVLSLWPQAYLFLLFRNLISL
jgi:hypothetical protein